MSLLSFWNSLYSLFVKSLLWLLILVIWAFCLFLEQSSQRLPVLLVLSKNFQFHWFSLFFYSLLIATLVFIIFFLALGLVCYSFLKKCYYHYYCCCYHVWCVCKCRHTCGGLKTAFKSQFPLSIVSLEDGTLVTRLTWQAFLPAEPLIWGDFPFRLQTRIGYYIP